jgi:putative ABC transport system permease protein
MNTLRFKLWHDLWSRKARTAQVVLIIGIGAAAIGLILATQNIVANRLSETWQASSPATIYLSTTPAVQDETIAALEHIEGVEAVEGYALATVEWRLSPNDEWQPANLIARQSYTDERYNRLTLVSGEWPRGKTFALWQGTNAETEIIAAGQVQMRIGKREYSVPINGLIGDVANRPSGMGTRTQFYTTQERFNDLFAVNGSNRLMAGSVVDDPATLTRIADKMQGQLEKLGVTSAGAAPSEGPAAGNRIVDPQRHYSQDVADGVFLILTIIAALALGLGLFLVYNTINAVISQQVDQIGVMKAMGASTMQIVQHYLSVVFTYAALALCIAIPLGIAGSWGLSIVILQDFNIALGGFTIPWFAIEVEIVVALLAPLAASLAPIVHGARLTVREAISTYGLNTGIGRLELLFTKLKRLPRMVILVFTNTFRHKLRVALTQITLIISGLIFMMVLSVADSTRYTFGDLMFSILQFNVNLQFEQPERIRRVEALTMTNPNVTAVEMWAGQGGKLRLKSATENNDDPEVLIFGVPVPTQLYTPQMRAGRWLQPGDSHAVVLNEIVAQKADVKVGDWIVIDQGVLGDTEWQVVGLLFDPMIANSAIAPRETLLREFGQISKASMVFIKSAQNGAASETALAADLRKLYEAHQLDLAPRSPFGAATATEITDGIVSQFGILMIVLAAMAVVMGLVGSIVLSGTLSLSVLERRREIGVMRAIGAADGAIGRLFIGEGLLLGWLSWLVAWPLSVPAGWFMVQALRKVIGMGLVFHYTLTGAFYWLCIISLLSIWASWLPARSAMGVSVCECLAYQ